MMICAQFEMRQQGDRETPSQDHDEGAAPEGRMLKLRGLAASVLPWVVISNGGQCAMYQPSSFLRTPKSLNSAWTATRIEKHWGEVKVRVKLYPLNRCNVNALPDFCRRNKRSSSLCKVESSALMANGGITR